MKRRMSIVCLVLLSATTAISCGGGGDGKSITTPGPSGSFVASFTPDDPAPGNQTVSLSQAPGGGGDLVTLNAVVRGVNDVFGASFRIAYDSTQVDFNNWFSGSFFEGSGNTALYQVSQVTPGIVEVGVSCAGCTTGVNATGAGTIVQLVFQVTKTGTSSVTFVAADLLDSNSPPTAIPGLNWSGGTFVAP